MKIFYKYILFALWLGIANPIQSQTLAQARALLTEGKYVEALPAFARYVKQSPSNANYNFWYGVCLTETGQTVEAIPYLKKAAARKVLDAYPYLIRAQKEQYRFDEAGESCEAYITLLQSKKRLTEEVEKELEHVRMAAMMLKGTEQVCIVDSFVVRKEDFLSVYNIGSESGKLETYDRYFHTEGHPGVVYQNELGQKLYLSQPQGDRLAIFTADKLMGEWSKPSPVNGLESDGNQNYPFLLSDGATFYYASDGNGSLGGYDIFVTRLNNETGKFLKPENVGMPYNSPANDYMMVVDEYNNLGWFASDRYQPTDSVCVYVFVPNTSRVTFDMETAGEETVRRAAQIAALRETWKDESVLRAARQRLTMLAYAQPNEQQKQDFTFIIDDYTTYHLLTDFRSQEARTLFTQWQHLTQEHRALDGRLTELRMQYAASGDGQKRQLTPAILDMEQREEKMREEMAALEVKVRNTEKNYLMK